VTQSKYLGRVFADIRRFFLFLRAIIACPFVVVGVDPLQAFFLNKLIAEPPAYRRQV
jgi:hypothetical protein